MSLVIAGWLVMTGHLIFGGEEGVMGFKRIELRRNVSTEHHSRVSYRDVWFINARPTIVRLISSGNDEEKASACQLITAWMDRCYTLCRFGFDKATSDPRKLMNEYTTKDIVCFFFGQELEFNVDKTGDGDNLAEVFNSLKHDGCLREEYKFTPYANIVRDTGDIPKRNNQNNQRSLESLVTVNPVRWVVTPLVKIDELFMDAIVVDEESAII
ncbi:MAG: hypothetical protein OXG53_11235 [Chloroflexi bacterium]|nr:hypothetical protein [Chloroflexota bacterium]